MVSRFIQEIPEQYLAQTGAKNPLTAAKERPRQDAWQQSKASFRSKPYESQTLTVTKASGLEYTTGDRVRHIKFGEGTVLEITEGKKDYEVKVEFDTAGIKRLFASFAKLRKL